MVRAPAHAPTRSSGFALLKPASRPQLDSARIVTLSGTIALNLLAMGLLMMPLSMPMPLVSSDDQPRDQTRWIPREQPEPEPVEFAKDVEPVPPQPATTEQRSVAPNSADSVSTPTIVDAGTEVATETTSEATGPSESFDSIEAAPAAMQLQYRLAPAPAYPRRALQQRLTGTVLLQVLVGIDGRPLEVKVAQSSGHRELDEAARAQVLARWTFQPATRAGQAVQAMGMVPIEFALRN